MKKSRPWHHTRWGTLTIWLGSIELAVPVLALTAAALAWGTYLDSTQNAQVARDAVYGSWWFIALMALVCVSLVFAVLTRLPWKRRHIGFIVVHASLIALITGGFWSMFGRVEGHLALEEGTSGNTIETQQEVLELLEHHGGQFETLATARPPRKPGALSLGAARLRLVERWENSRDESVVTDDSPEPFRAVLISPRAGMEGEWVGDEAKAGGASIIGGLRIRVLADGAAWEPPTGPDQGAPAFVFSVGEQLYPLAQEGQEVFPGWRIVSVRRFAKAQVAAAGLAENPSGPDNPAVEVVISDGSGSAERHTAFPNFPDMIMGRQIEGQAQSGATLVASGGRSQPETLVVYGPVSATRLGYIAPDGSGRALEAPQRFPATLDLGGRQVTITQQFARARGSTRTVRAPAMKENRPALVLRSGDATELTVVPWKSTAAVPGGSQNLMVRYGPRIVPLPFTVALTDFRKTDYPGTEMAMAYESDVLVTLPGQNGTPFRIFMNNPYAHGPWRVYQSGFIGETLSVFSVTRDPGLTLTYAACTFLCIGIVVIFYSRSLSWGHPGIPVPFAVQEKSHAKHPRPTDGPRPAPVGMGDPVGSCGP